MLLNINDNKFIIDLQEKFSECFPYLKIEFYDKPCACGKTLGEHHLLPCHLRLSDCRRMHDPGLFDIKSWYKTGRVEEDFERLYGLNVQIFRRDNHRWAPTCKTKALTLQQQSEIAQQSLRRPVPLAEVVEEGDFGYR